MHISAAAQRLPAGGRFARFALSSLFSAGVDLAAFELLCRLLEDAAGEAAAIVAATCIARAASALVNHVINYVLVFHSHAARGRATGLYALITVGKTLCSARLVAAAAARVPALPRLGAKMGADVLLKTYKPRDGRKEFSGVLAGYDDGAVSLTVGSETLRFEKPEIALVRLRCDF